MVRINIDILYKMAADFEQDTAPVTLPAGAVPMDYRDKSVPVVEEIESPPTTRFIFQRDLNAPTVKDLLLRFNNLYNLSRGAASVLTSMKKDIILHPTMGIDSYLIPINEEVEKINAIVGAKTD